MINGHEYRQRYYLADGVYPQYSIIIQTISKPQGAWRKRFNRMQEADRKDVERTLGVLQSQFAIARFPCRLWAMGSMK